MRRLLAAAVAGSLLAACALIANLPDYEEKKDSGDAEAGADSPVGPVPPPPVSSDGGPDAPFLGCDSPAAERPLAYFKLDEGMGLKTKDCVRGIEGIFSGAPTWAAGHIGPYAVAFDGGDAIDFGAEPAFAITGALTVTAWAWVDDISNAPRIVAKGGGPADRGWELNVEPAEVPFFPDGTIAFHIADADGGAETRAQIAAPPRGKWMHVAGVYEPGVAVRLYLNGMESLSVTTNVPTSMRNATVPLAIGRRSAADCCPLKGKVDDVRIFTRALSGTEIKRLAAE